MSTIKDKYWEFGLGKDVPGIFKFDVLLGKLNLPPLRDWQKRATETLEDLLNRQIAGVLEQPEGWSYGPYAYTQAPTGSGKTALIANHGEQGKLIGDRVIIVGRAKLVKQHWDSLVGYGWRDANPRTLESDVHPSSRTGAYLLSPAGYRYVVTTWQSGRADACRMENGEASTLTSGTIAYLYFDECHLGGCTRVDDVEPSEVIEDGVTKKSSFFWIREKWQPKAVIYVSATGYVVNEKLLGQRENHTFVYSMREAYKDDILHPVALIEIHSGTTAEIAFVEHVYGKSFDDIQELDEMVGEDHPELAGKLADGNVVIPRRNGKYADVALAKKVRHNIIQARYRSMIDIYFAKHSGKQAIFFLPNIRHAGLALEHFQAEVAKRGLSVRAEQAHTKEGEFDDHIDAFENGDIDVLFVVNMLQEGFDMPTLALAFDCRFYRKWSRAKVARLIQKIGRLARKYPGKPESRYYYARDITDYYKSRTIPQAPPLVEYEEKFGATPDIIKAREEEAARKAEEARKTEEVRIAEADKVKALLEAIADNVADGEPVPVEPVSTAEEIDTGDLDAPRKVYTVVTPLWQLRNVRDYREVLTRKLGDLLGVPDTEHLYDPPSSAFTDMFGGRMTKWKRPTGP